MLTCDFIIFNKSILRQTTPSFSSSLIFLVPWSPKNFATFLTRNWTCDNFKCNLNELFSPSVQVYSQPAHLLIFPPALSPPPLLPPGMGPLKKLHALVYSSFHLQMSPCLAVVRQGAIFLVSFLIFSIKNDVLMRLRIENKETKISHQNDDDTHEDLPVSHES